MITQMQNTTRTVLACALGAALLASLTVSAAGNGVAPPMRKFTLPKPAAEASFDRFIVKTRDGIATRSASPSLDAVNAAVARAGVGGITTAANNGATLNVERVRKMAVGADVFRFSRKLTRTEADAVLAQLRKDRDGAVRAARLPQAAHRLHAERHALHTCSGNTRIRRRASTRRRRGTSRSGAGVVVAVMDTGYLDHSDLAANIVPGYDFIGRRGRYPTSRATAMAAMPTRTIRATGSAAIRDAVPWHARRGHGGRGEEQRARHRGRRVHARRCSRCACSGMAAVTPPTSPMRSRGLRAAPSRACPRTRRPPKCST